MQAKHEINCLELPLIEHLRGPDFDKLPTLLTGKLLEVVIILFFYMILLSFYWAYLIINFMNACLMGKMMQW